MALKAFIRHNFGSFPRLAAWGFNAGVFIAITGMFTSRYAMSVGSITMACATVLNGMFMSKDQIKSHFQSSKWTWAFGLILLSVVTSFIGSEEMGFAWTRLRLYLPFLALPLIMVLSPKSKPYHYIHWTMFAITSASLMGLLVASQMFIDPENWRLAIEQGRALPTPINHIRFGMFLTFALLASVLMNLNIRLPRGWNYLVWTLSLVTFIVIMIISVRTSWILTFLGVVTILLKQTIQRKQYWWLAAGIVGLCLMCYLGYRYVPLIHTKVHYFLFDLNEYLNEGGVRYSDSERIFSLKNGYTLWLENKWTGVGSGDLYQALDANAIVQGIPVSKIPHNQFLFTMVCGGILSLTLLLTGLILGFKGIHPHLKFPIYLFVALYLTTMLIEPTFETSAGVMGFVLIATLLLKLNRDFTLNRQT